MDALDKSSADYERALERLAHAPPVPAPSTRLGVILPSVNTVVEPWFSAVLPTGVALHATRMLLAGCVTPEALRHMDHEEGMAAAERIASCRPHALAYCCTASSIVQGPAYDAQLCDALEQRSGCPSFTAVRAIVEALRSSGANRIAIASPYTDAIDHAERLYFEEVGFEVVGTANLGISDGFALASPTPADMYRLAHRAWRKEADALVISCLNMNSQQVAGLLEAELGLPVVTSTTATLWMLLGRAGLTADLDGYGRLLGGSDRPGQ